MWEQPGWVLFSESLPRLWSLPQGGALTWLLGGGLRPYHVAAPQDSSQHGSSLSPGSRWSEREREDDQAGKCGILVPNLGVHHGFCQHTDQPGALWEWTALRKLKDR